MFFELDFQYKKLSISCKPLNLMVDNDALGQAFEEAHIKGLEWGGCKFYISGLLKDKSVFIFLQRKYFHRIAGGLKMRHLGLWTAT